MGGNVLGVLVAAGGMLAIYLGISGRYNKLLSALGAVASPGATSTAIPGPTVGGASSPPAMGRQPGQTGPS